MKKLLLLAICLMLVSIPLATAATTPRQILPFAPTGSYEGSVGFRGAGGNWTPVGAINGSYELRNKGGRFQGDWNIQIQNTTANGTMRGLFRPPFMFGRISISDGRRAPIVGFLMARNNTFAGRFMAPVGPALYFKGTFT
jgi:hypothetical protein